ncbi:MAG: hypothetical protein HDR43_00710 [Mycoplasma sp.]|nr:hypothetical protein [Mycoplasma sp.]
MKLSKYSKYKIIFSMSFTSFSTMFFITSCKTENVDVKDKEYVQNFIAKLPKLEIKEGKDKSTIFANQLNNEKLILEWFSNIPVSSKDVDVEFISAKPLVDDQTTLEIEYKISKGNYSENVIFKEYGFKKDYNKPDLSQPTNNSFEEFAEFNSFKIILQASEVNGAGIYSLEQGTAWSWYYEQKENNQWDWYLMTNFHVVNNVITYVTNKRENDLLDYYKNSSITSLPLPEYSLILYQYDTQNSRYKTLISTDTKINGFVNTDQIKSMDIITDFNNDSIDLFSKKITNDNSYNLDMALIKISFQFNNNELLNNDYKRPNTINIYKDYSDYFIENKFDPNKKSYIGGNPSSQNKLINYELNQGYYLSYDTLNIWHTILWNLEGPYYFSKNNYKDFKLSGGASGSAIYQQPEKNNNNSWSNIVPVGIFWGGIQDSFDPTLFTPSLLPFIFNEVVNNNNISYNVYDNFINWIK